MTPEQITEARRLLDVSMADIPGDETDKHIDLRLHERTVAERTFMMNMAGPLLAEVEQMKRGGAELGKIVAFLGDLIKDAYVRGADDPIDALHMLGNVVAEVFEDEGGLSPDEFNRVYRALEARRAEEEKHRREGDEQRRAEVSRTLAETTPGGAR